MSNRGKFGLMERRRGSTPPRYDVINTLAGPMRKRDMARPPPPAFVQCKKSYIRVRASFGLKTITSKENVQS
ncbi:hypothetical protein EVAR_37061_1 [Eumeta japonica]|uniref:Uncharacterized protein n=1 Tax=Eumeta variegata TaxID=151549 RepID=A0A4C1WEX7_EUMVA|nr:hypothetical protein EVAR_37061_1 [Eumeta japonica]